VSLRLSPAATASRAATAKCGRGSYCSSLQQRPQSHLRFAVAALPFPVGRDSLSFLHPIFPNRHPPSLLLRPLPRAPAFSPPRRPHVDPRRRQRQDCSRAEKRREVGKRRPPRRMRRPHRRGACGSGSPRRGRIQGPRRWLPSTATKPKKPAVALWQ
jgi:hypothetical protein